jgi:hypothetical protein
MPTPIQSLKDKIDALTRVPDVWARRIEAYQPKLFTHLTKLLDAIELDGNAFAMTPSNFARVTEVMDGMREFMTRGEYAEIVKDFNSEIIKQNARTVNYFGTVIGGEPSITSFAAATYQTKRAQAIESVLSNTSLDGFLLTDLKATLTDAVATGSRYSNALESVRGLVTGTTEAEGTLLRYSRVIVSDTFATTDRAFTTIVAKDLGLTWYRYVGGEIATTRCFCDARNDRFFHENEIKAWGRLEDIGECKNKNGWAGRMPDTTENTIFTNAGGYNCQHSILPVSIFAVPKIDIQNAIEKGYYTPNAFEKKELKL